MYCTSKMSLAFHFATFGLHFCLAVNLQGSFANLYLLSLCPTALSEYTCMTGVTGVQSVSLKMKANSASEWFVDQKLASYRVSTHSGKSLNVREYVRGSGKVREIRDVLEKVREENFYPCNF